jgi:hypothetical protein
MEATGAGVAAGEGAAIDGGGRVEEGAVIDGGGRVEESPTYHLTRRHFTQAQEKNVKTVGGGAFTARSDIEKEAAHQMVAWIEWQRPTSRATLSPHNTRPMNTTLSQHLDGHLI